MKAFSPSLLALSTVGLLAFASAATASVVGTSNASSSVFNDGWQTGDDGDITGNGFNGWNLTASTAGGGVADRYVGDSTALAPGNNGANINSGGRSWGLYGVNGGAGLDESNAFGFFNGALSVGQTFSIDIAVNFRNGYKGIDLRNDGNDATIFNFNIGDVGSGDDYTVAAATTGNGSIGNTYSSNTAFHLAFTQTSAGGGSWAITRSGGVSDFDTGTYTGVPSSFKLYVGETSGGSESDLLANNMSIVPEPSTLMMLAGGVGVLMSIHRRHRRS